MVDPVLVRESGLGHDVQHLVDFCLEDLRRAERRDLQFSLTRPRRVEPARQCSESVLDYPAVRKSCEIRVAGDVCGRMPAAGSEGSLKVRSHPGLLDLCAAVKHTPLPCSKFRRGRHDRAYEYGGCPVAPDSRQRQAIRASGNSQKDLRGPRGPPGVTPRQAVSRSYRGALVEGSGLRRMMVVMPTTRSRHR
jgi:hypothetical protein